jgi:putative DNA primase/helicase
METGSANFKLPDHIVNSMGLEELKGGELDIDRVSDLADERVAIDVSVQIDVVNSLDTADLTEGVIQQNPVDPIAQLLIAVETDEGACLETDAVAMLADLYANNQAEYRRVRNKLKKANKNVSLAAVDKSVLQMQKAGGLPDTHHVFAKALLAELTHDGHKPVSADGVLNVLDPSTNIWRPVTQEQLENKVAQLHDGKPNCERRSDYNSVAVHAMNLVSSVSFFADAPVGVACPGGFYHVEDGHIKVTPLKPEHRQRLMLNYTPTQMAIPIYEKFLHETFQTERELEETQQTLLLQEISGAVMFGLMPRYHKAALFFDPYGRAGKGTECDILYAMVPPEYVTNVSPFRWNAEYYLANLAMSRLNLVGELPENTPLPAADFKTVTGGDLLTGRHPTGRPFSFRNQAAHIFSSNHLPTTRDQSDALFARWEMLEFPNSRLRNGQDLDAGLAKRIIAAELPGIAHWAMQGALRLLANGKFSESKAADRLMAKWRQSTNSLEEFIGECCSVGEQHSIKRSTFYECYVSWCQVSGRKPYAKSHVRDLLEHNIKLGIAKGSKDGYDLYRGICVKKPEADPSDF